MAGGRMRTEVIQHRWHSSSVNSAVSGTPPSAETVNNTSVPFRKRLKDEARQAKASRGADAPPRSRASRQTVPGWELTVGIEIHAQLNTGTKLFSPAPSPGPIDQLTTTSSRLPNTDLAPFDLAIPGSHPVLQPSALVPAIRASLALGCTVQPESAFDRKHYFHHDQPAGYQITQYHAPLAVGGLVRLLPRDGIAREDYPFVDVRIERVQIEQDTAKTTTLLEDGNDGHQLEQRLVDYGRAGVALVEIITAPDIHHPATAAAFVRKVQALLASAGACVDGMETGGLRADVNVSVRRVADGDGPASARQLGVRTEIKNLSSLRAVEDAVVAERDRQIAVLEAGGTVEQETRGWTLGATETRRLRGKEGEVDYRYMPDPDLGPLLVSTDLVERVRATLGHGPDEEIDFLMAEIGLTEKDAVSLAGIDGGRRLEYFYDVLDELWRMAAPLAVVDKDLSRLAANWILHELGRLTADPHAAADPRAVDPASAGAGVFPGRDSDIAVTSDDVCARVPASALADIVWHLHTRLVTGGVAKDLLFAVHGGDLLREHGTVADAVRRKGLLFRELAASEYESLAWDVVNADDDEGIRQVVEEVARAVAKGKEMPKGKVMFVVGKVMRSGPREMMDPIKLEVAVRAALQRKLGA